MRSFGLFSHVNSTLAAAPYLTNLNCAASIVGDDDNRSERSSETSQMGPPPAATERLA
jgi:hypothetical protein